LRATIQLADNEGWRRCYNCQALVEHNQGCIHMTCKCRAEFCYICGLKWRTCSCSESQLVLLRRAADARRNESLARERAAQAAERAAQAAEEAAQAEAEELREALELIEVFEMEELAREAAAIEAAGQQREAERLSRIDARYAELRGELEFVHDMQRILMTQRYEHEFFDGNRDYEERNVLKLRQAAELQLAETTGKAVVSESQSRFDVEYQARLASERDIEDDYVKRLQEYWGSDAEGEAKVQEQREAYRQVTSDSFQEWCNARKSQQRALINSNGDTIFWLRRKHALEQSALTEQHETREGEIRRMRIAEEKWFEAVVLEREDMLRSMEQDEYTRRED